MRRYGTSWSQPGTEGEPERTVEAEGTVEPGRIEDIAELEVTEPTLTWLEVSRPHQPIPIGEDDRVLDSYFNPQHDVWEVLLLANPEEEDD